MCVALAYVVIFIESRKFPFVLLENGLRILMGVLVLFGVAGFSNILSITWTFSVGSFSLFEVSRSSIGLSVSVSSIVFPSVELKLTLLDFGSHSTGLNYKKMN